MIQERDIRDQLAALIRREVSLSAFERWLASESWNMFNEGSLEVIELIAAINLLVSEFHDSVINDKQFSVELLSLLNHVRRVLVFDEDLNVIEANPRVLATFRSSMARSPRLVGAL